MKLLYHTASLYQLYPAADYEATLDERISVILTAGADGVELSNGPRGILDWQPTPAIIKLLQKVVVTIHAELDQNYRIAQLVAKLKLLPFRIANITFHPDELLAEDWFTLRQLPWPVSVENMDANRSNWCTPAELLNTIPQGVGLTLDTAHVAEHNLTVKDFRPLFTPQEMHLSTPTPESHHTPYCLAPKQAIHVPSGCPISVLEGSVPDLQTIADEVNYVRNNLQWI